MTKCFALTLAPPFRIVRTFSCILAENALMTHWFITFYCGHDKCFKSVTTLPILLAVIIISTCYQSLLLVFNSLVYGCWSHFDCFKTCNISLCSFDKNWVTVAIFCIELDGLVLREDFRFGARGSYILLNLVSLWDGRAVGTRLLARRDFEYLVLCLRFTKTHYNWLKLFKSLQTLSELCKIPWRSCDLKAS